MERIYLAFLLAALILASVATLVRSSGQSHILTINYARITDPEQLHRWAAKLLSRASFTTALLALAAFTVPSHAELLLGIFFIVLLGAVVAISLGARKFRQG